MAAQHRRLVDLVSVGTGLVETSPSSCLEFRRVHLYMVATVWPSACDVVDTEGIYSQTQRVSTAGRIRLVLTRVLSWTWACNGSMQ